MVEAQDWRPRAGPQIAGLRSDLLARARQYFDASGALEVDTPVLNRSAPCDPNIEALTVTSMLHELRPAYLQTSPEYCMKRLLCAGYGDLFQLCKVFRDGETGRLHQPEFTMLEWYRLGNGLDAIIGDALHCVAAMLQRPAVARDAERLEYAAAMHRFAGVDVLQADCRALWRAAGGDESLWQSIGSDRGSWLDLLLSQRVVPALAADRLTVLRHFPAEQAALARLCPRDARFADRFELFFGTIELANGYVELLDADELRCRTDADMKTRRASGKPLPETDTALIAAMTAGMPACAGVALGLDRLLMIAAGCDDIRDVMTFPL